MVITAPYPYRPIDRKQKSILNTFFKPVKKMARPSVKSAEQTSGIKAIFDIKA